MRRVKHTLRGSTLAETLVVMLVTGIVFLAAMEALTLVSRLVARRAAVLVEAGRQRDGIFRLGQLLTTADSIRSAEGGADAGETPRQYSSRGSSAIRSCVVSGTCSSYAAMRRPIPSKSTSGAIC